MKKAAPAKESGLQNMPADYSQHRVEDHEAFILEQLLPLIFSYARSSSTPGEVVALSSFLSLSTILLAKGLSRATLMNAIGASRLPIYDAPEALQ